MKATISFQDTDTGQVDVRVEAALTQPQLLAAPAAQQAAHPAPAEGDALLRMLANRARTFPNYPLGYHIPEVFAALGEEPPKPNVQPKGTDKPFGWLDVHPDGRERIARPGRLHDSDARWVRKATLYEHPPETPDDAWAAAHQLSTQSHQDFIRGVQWATQRGKK